MRALHNRKQMVALALGVVLLAGCKEPKVPDTVEQTSLVLDREGRIVSHMVDVFDKSHYNISELREMAEAEVAAYNKAYQTETEPSVVVESAESEDGEKVHVVYSYDSAKTYGTYNGVVMFYGTVAQAEAEGYDFGDLNQVLYDAKGNKSMVSSRLSEKAFSKKHVVLIAEETLVYCPYKVSYASENAYIREDGSVDTAAVSAEEYPVIILLDK